MAGRTAGGSRAARFFGRFVPTLDKHTVIACAVLLLVLWLPYIVIMFPGGMNWDTYYQMYQCFRSNGPAINVSNPEQPVYTQFHDHHPVMLSLFYGFFAVVSEHLFGTWTWGAFLLALLQVTAFAFTLSFVSCYLERLGAPRWARVASLLFFGLCPAIAIYCYTILKDVSFSLPFIWWFIMLIEIVRSKGEVLEDRRFFGVFLALCIVMPLTKKMGLYLIAPSTLVFALAYRAQWKRLLVATAAPVLVMFVVLPYLVFPVLGVTPGGKQEALNTLFQQTARYVVVHGDDISDEDRAVIDKVLDYDTLAERYDPQNTNSVKDGFNYEATSDDLRAYFGVWFKEFLDDPALYAESVWLTVDGFFVPYRPLWPHTDTITVGNGGAGELISPNVLKPAKTWLNQTYYALAEVPVVGLLLMTAFYNVIVPAVSFIGACASKRRRWCLILFVPVLLTVLSSLVSFESFNGRYIVHLAYIAPMLLACGFCTPQAPSSFDRVKPLP